MTSIPTVTISHSKHGVMVVNRTELLKYELKGWTEGATPAEPELESKVFDFSKYGLVPLRAYCGEAKIAWNGKTEAQLRSLLVEAGFTPGGVS